MTITSEKFKLPFTDYCKNHSYMKNLAQLQNQAEHTRQALWVFRAAKNVTTCSTPNRTSRTMFCGVHARIVITHSKLTTAASMSTKSCTK